MITLNYSNVKDRLSNLSCVYEGTIAFPDIILKTFLVTGEILNMANWPVWFKMTSIDN